MAFQTPITIKQALTAIQRMDYVLPAIQREFTWRPDQIAGLFDSLMQGYPIGSLLFWKVEPEHSADYTWYGVIRDYHQKKNAHCPKLDLPSRPLVAILDGQQRLTSLNIGLRGSHAEKAPRMWWNNPDAFPVKHLYLNLLDHAAANEQGFKFDFRFLTARKAAAERDDTHVWFKVSEVYDFKEDFDVILALQGMELGNNQQAARLLHRLYAVVNKDLVLPYFEETEQDLDKVLNIFIRVNSAGTPLSYSDLLLSIATAQWRDVDAREAIHGIVDELNETRHAFQLSKDLVLKAGLMLSDIPSVQFRVTNFNSRNMRTLEENWQGIAAALKLAVELLADFGFSRQTLAADSVIIPVAYYLYKRGLGESYLTAVRHAEDREGLRGWVCRSLVKSGVWGSGLDTLLLALRVALRDHGGDGFPVDEVDAAMAKRGKVLRFTEDEIQDLLDSAYGDKRTFALLALLYPFVDLRNVFHADHVFPRSRFTVAKLRNAGVPEDRIEVFHDKANRLANLQLLEGSANKSKQDKLPAAWLAERYPDEGARANYCDLHDLGAVPDGILDFEHFYEARRDRIAARLRAVLKGNGSTAEDEVDPDDSGGHGEGAPDAAGSAPGEAASAVLEASSPSAGVSFRAVLAAIDARPPDGLIPGLHRVRGYQAWRPDEQHWALHYELLAHEGTPPTIEIHIEHRNLVVHARPLLAEWATSLAPEFQHAQLEFDPTWSRNKGRLTLTHPDQTDVATRADDFVRLVQLTKHALWPDAFTE